MKEMKQGKLKSGGSGTTVHNPKQAIAIGLSKARRSGVKVPAEASEQSGVSSEPTHAGPGAIVPVAFMKTPRPIDISATRVGWDAMRVTCFPWQRCS